MVYNAPCPRYFGGISDDRKDNGTNIMGGKTADPIKLRAQRDRYNANRRTGQLKGRRAAPTAGNELVRKLYNNQAITTIHGEDIPKLWILANPQEADARKRRYIAVTIADLVGINQRCADEIARDIALIRDKERKELEYLEGADALLLKRYPNHEWSEESEEGEYER